MVRIKVSLGSYAAVALLALLALGCTRLGRAEGGKGSAEHEVKIENPVKSEDADSDEENAEPVPEENDVLVLSKNNFDDVISNNEFVLVEFYAPWCGHCKQLTPHFEKAAARLKVATPPVRLAKVDATVETELGSRFEVSGYPTLKWFRNGTPSEYDGPRQEDGIVDYATEHSSPDWKPPPEQVVVLTSENFAEVTDHEDLVVVMFYAPWCGHCKQMAPEYEKAAKELKKMDKPVTLAKVDATVEKDLATKYEVSGYPTMKIFRKGRVHSYNGEARDNRGMMVYIDSQIGPASKQLPHTGEISRMTAKAEVPVHIVAFFDESTDVAFQTYSDTAEELRDEYQFAHVFGAPARAQYKLATPASVVVFIADRFQSTFEPKWHVLELKSDTKLSVVKSFVVAHNVPLVGEYNQGTKDRAYKTRRPLVLFFCTVDWTYEHREATQRWRARFGEVARRFPDLTFALADEESNPELFRAFNFDDSGEEINVGVLGEKDRKYPMKPMEEFDLDEVADFIKKFKKGAIKPKIRSAPAPKKASKPGQVVVVVGDTFDRIVLDDKKDVLIELYAPWCGHCKNLEPVYAALAKKLKDDPNIVIAKMDATANDAVDGYDSTGFPTIYFAPAGGKKLPVKFDGERTAEGMEKWLRERAVVSFGGKKKKTKEEL